jgi:hypothetical protein
VRSYGSASVTATYTGPLPGTLCYDADCGQAAPGYYTAPPEEVISTWTNRYTKPCPPNHRGEIIVTEGWRTVKYWTPSAGGLSSRGTLVFRSNTRDERVGYREDPSNCVPLGYLRLNVILATPLGDDPNPYVEARGPENTRKTTWGTSTYDVQAGTYTVSARNIEKTFTSGGLSYWAQYTPSINPASVNIPSYWPNLSPLHLGKKGQENRENRNSGGRRALVWLRIHRLWRLWRRVLLGLDL